MRALFVATLGVFATIGFAVSAGIEESPSMTSELIFPLEHWHNHASMIVEAPNGDLLVCWYHGSGERTEDDVVIRGARFNKKTQKWSEPFLLADTPGYPDTNPTMFIDPRQRLWLLWPTILANEWETALMKYKISSDYQREGPPRWEVSEVLHVTPGDEFKTTVDRELDQLSGTAAMDDRRRQMIAELRKQAGNKLARRLGWMTRAHPYVLNGTRLIVPLYSDLFSFSLMAITDDWGATWKTSTPLVAFGNIQPSLVRKKDGTLVAYMRDNGPPPNRLHVSQSQDRGETWSTVHDSTIPNPGSGAEAIALANGHWVLIYNDIEEGRYSLAVSLSEDEGATWPFTRHLEMDPPSPPAATAGQARLSASAASAGQARQGQQGEYHYPSIIQARDGTLHATYSYFIPPIQAKRDEQGREIRKAIKHAHFNEAWIRARL
ncbi:MAG: exo-alpha-sialidase [Acidobacteria bacterium]|nr:exo-alpha-sialidase [Acidobacteriota bacterium]